MKAFALPILLTFAATSADGIACAQESASQRLTDDTTIRATLSGKALSYSPPGRADSGIAEEFHGDGLWGGAYFSRGPVPFTGRWKVESGRVCVLPDADTLIAKWFSGWRYRMIWRDGRNKHLAIEYLDPRFASLQPLFLTAKDIPAVNR